MTLPFLDALQSSLLHLHHHLQLRRTACSEICGWLAAS
jgi:hypothetical protein